MNTSSPPVVSRLVCPSGYWGGWRENWQWVSGEVIQRERHTSNTRTAPSGIGHDHGGLPTGSDQQHVNVGWITVGDVIQLNCHFSDCARHTSDHDIRRIGPGRCVIKDRDRRRVCEGNPSSIRVSASASASRCCRGGGERKHTVGGRILGGKPPRARRWGKAIAGNRPRPADGKEPITLQDNGDAVRLNVNPPTLQRLGRPEVKVQGAAIVTVAPTGTYVAKSPDRLTTVGGRLFPLSHPVTLVAVLTEVVLSSRRP